MFGFVGVRSEVGRRVSRLPGPLERAVHTVIYRGRLVGRWFAEREDESRTPRAITTIDPADEMFDLREPSHYFAVGRSALAAVKAGLQRAGDPEVRRILDFPCGHGRVLRMLRAEWPDGHITACDLNRDGVDFCARVFAAEPVYSANTINSVVTSGGYDLVWVGSLLTHLDEPRWPEMLGWFRDQLRTGGVLIFTAHGEGAIDRVINGDDYHLGSGQLDSALRGYRSCGFGYSPYPGERDYGASFTTPEWVTAQIERVGGLVHIDTAVRGWDGHQDVVTCRVQ